MSVIATDVDSRYWIVTDVDPVDGTNFDINMKQVADHLGTPFQMKPAPRRTIRRAQNPAVGTIILVVDTTTVDRQFTVNPAT